MQDAYVGEKQVYENPSRVHDRAQSPLKALSSFSLEDAENILFGNYYRFCFVRNPFTRSLSAYLDKLVNNAYERRRHLPLLGFEKNDQPSFLDYLLALEHIEDTQRDIHHQTQTALLCSGSIEFDFVGHFETFNRDFFYLQHLIYDDPSAADYADFGKHHSVQANTKAPLYYTGTEDGLVRKLYERDFENFHYSSEPTFSSMQGRRTRTPSLDKKGFQLKCFPKSIAKPNNTENFKAAWKLMLAKRFSEAQAVYTNIAQQNTNNPLGHRAFDCALFCHMKGSNSENSYTEIKSNLTSIVYQNTIIPIYEASHAIYEGDWERYWQLAPTLSVFDPVWFGPWNRGLFTRPEFEASRAFHEITISLLSQPDFPTKVELADPVLLMVADATYVLQHAELAVESYRATGGTENICLIILNPTSEVITLANSLLSKYENLHIRFKRGVPSEKAYYASARYILAVDIMREFLRPVFVFDVDVAFQENVNQFFTRTNLDRDKIGLRVSPGYCYPWQKITVNCTYLPYTPGGLCFAIHMQQFLKMHFSVPDKVDLWWIDQNAALSAYAFAEKSHIQSLNVNGFLSLPKLYEDKKASLSAAIRGRAHSQSD